MRGVALSEFEAEPFPTPFTARTSTAYAVPLVSPLMVKDPDVPPVLTQEPPLREYSTRETSVVHVPPSVDCTAMDSSLGVTDTSVGADGDVTGSAFTIMS